MANYHKIVIETPKMTQNVALDIFQYLAQHNRIRSFDFNEGELSIYIRGYTELSSLLISHGFDKEDYTSVADEFTLAYSEEPCSIWEFETKQ